MDCLKHGEGTSCQVMALRRPYLCLKTTSESKAVPGGFITGQWIILAGTELGETARQQSERQHTDPAEQHGHSRDAGKAEWLKNFSRVNRMGTTFKLSSTQ